MPVVQVALNFADEIWAGIARGDYTANGSIVRDLTGAIVTHVPEVKLALKPDKFDASRIADSLKHPKVLAVIGIGLVVAIGITALVAGKKKQEAAPHVPESIQNYDSALSAYLIAIHNGSLDSSILKGLIAALTSLRQDVDAGIITVISPEAQSTDLLNIVREYTTKFAEANGFEPGGLEARTPDAADDSISSLLRYLDIQERIIHATA